ncbi:hypothetical protein AGLY_015059 [Aphis glycines]|uniref:Uncharacterized protein n=1 Tax=Aphis glycines TaxID=307491 RepID=A0A6G0T360_APHGL|nr:hypothetical protein AGLY_015059 [Aphis glycines]
MCLWIVDVVIPSYLFHPLEAQEEYPMTTTPACSVNPVIGVAVSAVYYVAYIIGTFTRYHIYITFHSKNKKKRFTQKTIIYNKNIMSARSSILYTFEGCYFFPLIRFFIFIENPIRSRNDDDKITTIVSIYDSRCYDDGVKIEPWSRTIFALKYKIISPLLWISVQNYTKRIFTLVFFFIYIATENILHITIISYEYKFYQSKGHKKKQIHNNDDKLKNSLILEKKKSTLKKSRVNPRTKFHLTTI